MTDECRETFHVRYGRYPGPLDALAFAMFCAGWEEARRSPDARTLPPPDGWVNEHGEFTSDMSKVQHPLSVCSWKPVWCELSLLGIPRLESP